MFGRSYEEKERLFEIFGQIRNFCCCIELRLTVMIFVIFQLCFGVVYFFYGLIIFFVVLRRDLKFYGGEYSGNYLQAFYNMFIGVLCFIMGVVGCFGRSSLSRQNTEKTKSWAKWYLYLWYFLWSVQILSGLFTILIFIVTKHTFSFKHFGFVKRYSNRGLILFGLCFSYAIWMLFYTYCLLAVFSYYQKYFVDENQFPQNQSNQNQQPQYYQFGNQQGFQQNLYQNIGQQYGQQPPNMYRPISDESQQRYYGQQKQ